MKHEDGFHFLEFPCKSGKPGALIIFLHGHSNHPDMFADLAQGIQREWPDADVLMVRGPEPVHSPEERKKHLGVPNVDDLYTWYKVDYPDHKTEQQLLTALKHLFNQVPVVDDLNKFVDAQLAKRGLKDESLVLYGFSLGGAMAVQMATRRGDKCAAVVCHSSPVFPIVKPKSKPDTMLLMGDQDHFFYTKVRTVEEKPGRLRKAFDKALSRISIHYNSSLARLKRAGLPATGVVVKGLYHTITPDSFEETLKFIGKHLKK